MGVRVRQMRIAFDIGGVLSKYPDQFRRLLHRLTERFPTFFGVDIFVITDMHDVDEVYEMLVMNGFDMIHKDNVYCADYKTHGEGCKAELLRDLEIDLFFDDFLGYMMLPSDTIRCLVIPDPHRPYWHKSWKTKDKSDFGRRVYTKPWVHGSSTAKKKSTTSTSGAAARTRAAKGRNGATRSPSKKARLQSSSSPKTKSSRATKRGSSSSRS